MERKRRRRVKVSPAFSKAVGVRGQSPCGLDLGEAVRNAGPSPHGAGARWAPFSADRAGRRECPPREGGEGSVRPPSWCPTGREKRFAVSLGQHRTIAEASAVESPIRQETIGFPAYFFARAHNFKPPGRACQPEADSPMRT